jgi:hypothetical protein
MNLGSMQRGILRGGGILGGPGEPLFGEEVDDIETLEQQILDNPDDYDDGTPVYVDDLDGGGTGGWVVVYDGNPVPTTLATPGDVVNWIDSYGIPDGIAVWVDDPGDGSDGGLFVPIDGVPVPADSLTNVSACTGGTNTNGTYIPGSRDDDNFGVEPSISDDVLISTGTVS